MEETQSMEVGGNEQARAVETGDRPCRRCGRALAFVKNCKSGKIIPLDLKAPVYIAYVDGNGELWCVPVKDWFWALNNAQTPEAKAALTEHIEGAYVSHFATCPHANEFSRKAK